MATWKRVNGTPVTVEREVRVFNPENGQEGYVRARFVAGCCRLSGPVVQLERFYNPDGSEYRDPLATIIDRNPVFE